MAKNTFLDEALLKGTIKTSLKTYLKKYFFLKY